MKTAEHEHAHGHHTLELKISVKDGKTCEKILKVEVSQDNVAHEFDHFYQEIAPTAKVPGFRPGKATRQVLELHYKGQAHEHVVQHLISESYRQAIKEKSIEPLNFPDVKDVKFDGKKLSYEALVEVRPKVKLSRAVGLSAKKEKTAVKADEIEQALKRIQESLAQYKSVEDRASALGDCVVADYVCAVEGKEIEKRKDDWFELQTKEEYLKGFSEQLVGVKAGDEREVKVTFPKDFGRKEAAGKEAVFSVKVKEIKSKLLPELNDELAKSAGEFKTLAELKERIEKDLAAGKEREIEMKYERDLLDEFIKHNKVEYPEGLVKRRAEKMMENAARDLKARGSAEDKIKDMQEKMKAEFEKEARRQVHLAFLLEEVAGKENITVTDEDLKVRYAKVAADVHQPADVVEKYYADHEEALDSLRDQIRSEKAIQFLKDNAKKD